MFSERIIQDVLNNGIDMKVVLFIQQGTEYLQNKDESAAFGYSIPCNFVIQNTKTLDARKIITSSKSWLLVFA